MHSDFCDDDIYFGKQFLLTSEPLTTPFDRWNVFGFAGRWLYAHPRLSFASARNGVTEILALGTLLDPDKPDESDNAVVDNITHEARNFGDLEDAIFRLGGRWVLMVTIGESSRIYHDATGLKPVHFLQDGSGVLQVGSTPAILEEAGYTARDDALCIDFERYKNSGSWPVHVLPYPGVRQLLPNHFLDLEDARIERFWPKSSLPNREVTDVADAMMAILRGTLRAAMHRQPCILSLTGGYDSRLVLAAALDQREALSFFTVIRDDSPSHDVSVPKRIAKFYGLPHHFFDATPNSATLSTEVKILDRKLSRNVGGLFYDPIRHALGPFTEATGNKLHVPGNISEVHRCFYFPNASHPNELGAEDLARRAGFAGNPYSKQGFQKWLDEFPRQTNVLPLDLLYWEHRTGVWGSTGWTYREAASDRLPSMNSRAFLELGLCTSASERQRPHRLTRALISRGDPELLRFPFNTDWRESLVEWWSRYTPLPWRVKRRLGWV